MYNKFYLLNDTFILFYPLSDKYPSLSPYSYCALNPVILVDPDGREIWITGQDAQAAFDDLTHSTKIELKFVDGQVSLSNPNTNRDELDKDDQLLFDAIVNPSVKAEIITTRDPSNKGGEYHGTIYDDIDQTATSTNKVNVKAMNQLEKKNKAPRGSGIKHEATEGFIMGLESIKQGRTLESAWQKEKEHTFYDRTGKPYHVNSKAGQSPDYELYRDVGHKNATPAPNEWNKKR